MGLCDCCVKLQLLSVDISTVVIRPVKTCLYASLQNRSRNQWIAIGMWFHVSTHLVLRVLNSGIRIVHLEFIIRFEVCCKVKHYDVTCITSNEGNHFERW